MRNLKFEIWTLKIEKLKFKKKIGDFIKLRVGDSLYVKEKKKQQQPISK